MTHPLHDLFANYKGFKYYAFTGCLDVWNFISFGVNFQAVLDNYTSVDKTISMFSTGQALKEITNQTDQYLVNLSSKTYVFEDKMNKY